jgi:ubiquinone/menaquinone biosynthesis C-methylase UbiE
MSEKMGAYMEEPLRGFIADLSRVLAAIGVRAGQHVADIGAGTGVVTEALAKAVTRGGAQGGRVYALDVSPFFLHGLRERRQRLQATNAAAARAIEVHPCGTSDLGAGVPDGSLDVIFLADVLHHLPDADATLRAVHRALKPRGRIVVLENDRAKYMEAVARAHPQQFQQMLRANIQARAAQQQQGGAHAHGHSHGDAGHSHGHSHSAAAADAHSHGHGHSHAHSHGESAGCADAGAVESDLPLEEAVAQARKIVSSIPPEDPARLTDRMRDAGLTFDADLTSAVQLDDVHFVLAFSKADAAAAAVGAASAK